MGTCAKRFFRQKLLQLQPNFPIFHNAYRIDPCNAVLILWLKWTDLYQTFCNWIKLTAEASTARVWTLLVRTTLWPTHSPLTPPGHRILTWTDWPRYPWSWLPYKTHPPPTSLWTLDTQFLLHPLFLLRPWARTLTSWSLSGWEWRIEPAVAMIDVATDKTTITTFQGDQQFRTCASYEENALCCCFPGTSTVYSVIVFMTGPPHLQHRKDGNFWTGPAFPNFHDITWSYQFLHGLFSFLYWTWSGCRWKTPSLSLFGSLSIWSTSKELLEARNSI